MTRRVPVPIDGSPHADARWSTPAPRSPTLRSPIPFVLDPFGYYEEHDGFPDRLDDWYVTLERRADRPFEEAAEHGVEIDTTTEQGRPDRAIVRGSVRGAARGLWL